MWVFTYGSLMYDGWQEGFECLRSEKADLRHFRRDFNKASAKFWGSIDAACPTLGIKFDAQGTCEGIAFEFPDAGELPDRILLYLGEREGRSFNLRQEYIHLSSGDVAEAIVPINEYNANPYAKFVYLGDKSTEERAVMARKAVGVSGRCEEYVEGFRAKLLDLGIEDPHVEKFWSDIKTQHLNARERSTG